MRFLARSILGKLLLITGMGTSTLLLAVFYVFWQVYQLLARAATTQGGSSDLAEGITGVLISGGVLMAIAIVLAFITFLWFTRRHVVEPMGAVVAGLGRLAEGDFTVQIAVRNQDEIGHLAASALKIRDSLGTALRQVTQSATDLTAEANHLAGVAEATNSGVSSQQRETDQVATAMNEMTATVGEVARSAAHAADAAGRADQEAHEGKRVVSATIERIDALATDIEQTAETINRLEGDSTEISSVLDVIRGIAEQTNLLALNAAIEAARAGEQGRGFAVVADEVRTLASRTQKSTEEIQAMIQRLQSGTRNAVTAMNKNRDRARQAVEQAANAGAALESIASSVTSINDMNNQIASASEQQGAVAEEINRNIVTISQVAEESAEGAQQIALAGRQLLGLAHNLQGMTAHFRL